MLGPPLSCADRVLAHVPSWVGDAVAVEPALRRLARATGGGERLTLALPSAIVPLFEGVLPRARRVAHARRGAERAAGWRGHDVALLFPGSFRGAWTALAAGIPRRVGQARDGRGWLLTDRARPPLERGASALGRGLRGRGRRWLPRSVADGAAELLGLVGLAVNDPRPRLAPAAGARARAEARLAALGLGAGEPFVLACVGARAGSAKGYPPELWAAALDALAAAGAPRALVACGPGEEALLAETARRARSRPLACAPAPDLGLLLALAERARLALCADGGSRHVVAAAGAPLVCVFGPTDPRHGAAGIAHASVLRVEVPCGPCHRERCPLPTPDERRCLRELAPERVAEAARRVLERPREDALG